MPLAINVMNGAHMSAMAAQAVNGNSVNAGITATGTTRGTAAAMTADVTVISSGAAGTGVSLYSMMPGDDQTVYNSTSTTKYVYPASATIAINQLSVGNGFILPPYTGALCKTVSATQILGFMSA